MALKYSAGGLFVLALLGASCGSSPTAATPPTSTTTTTIPASYTVSGTVTATNGGQPLSGLAVDLNGQPSTTNGAGLFSYALTSGSTSRLTLTGATIVPRALTVNVGSARTVAIGAIGLAGFDLGFYQKFARDGFDHPAQLQPLRRWTRTPSIYLKVVDEAGEAIHAPTLDLIEATLKDGVPRWTSGVLGTPTIERGTASRVGVSGWITVRFPAEEVTQSCGLAEIAVDGGWIELPYHLNARSAVNCRGDGTVVALSTVRHELGHALGFFHTGAAGDLMSGSSYTSNNQFPAARELAAAAIAYARPIGNVDPDSDPTSTVNLAPMTVR